ncbi:MAG: hypothetical protein HZC42_13875 [Candidatus Eisenbacteria bacterium]|nr:hypothetical protein [Candidatus Eisenbacteria bacterium]
MRCTLAMCAALTLLAGCSLEHRTGAALSPTGRNSVEVLAAMDRDCLQYPVGKDAAGNQVWHADYVYFYLVYDRDLKPFRGPDGRPLARALLYHEAVAFMEKQPEIPGTTWIYRIQRIVRHVKDGRVVRDEPARVVDGENVWKLLDRDRSVRAAAARSSGVSLR